MHPNGARRGCVRGAIDDLAKMPSGYYILQWRLAVPPPMALPPKVCDV
jgi:hypothetical protein